MTKDWQNDIANFDPVQWTVLKYELDALTYGRFSTFFEKQVLKCCELYNEVIPLLAMNMNFIEGNKDVIFGGDIISRSGEKGAVDSVSYETKGAHNLLHAVDTGDKRHNPLINKPIITMLDKFFLRSNVMNPHNFMCGGCWKDTSCDSCGCGNLTNWTGCLDLDKAVGQSR